MKKSRSSSKNRRRNKKTLADIPIVTSVALILLGLFLGSVFLSSVLYFNMPIEKEKAESVTATFDSYRIVGKKRHHSGEVALYFSDSESYTFPSQKTEHIEALDDLKKGEKLELLIHPNTDSVMEMKSGRGVLLSFEESSGIMKNNRIGFSVFACFMYSVAVMGVLALLMRYLKHRKAIIKKTDIGSD